MQPRVEVCHSTLEGMADLTGNSAKFGSYRMVDIETNQVIDVQLVQVNEIGTYIIAVHAMHLYYSPTYSIIQSNEVGGRSFSQYNVSPRAEFYNRHVKH